MSIDIDSDINDVRIDKHFKGISFSKFKKVDVKKELLNSLIHSKIEPSCYWSAELICAGHFSDLWEVILLFFSKYVHLSNMNISPYLNQRIDNFKSILNNGYSDNILRMRNNQKIRNLFCEIMCVLCDSKRRHSFDNISIKNDDLNMVTIKDKFKADSTEYATEIYKKDDPKELFPFINEFAFCLDKKEKNIINACYWIEWIIEFENRCKLRREPLICERRTFMYSVESKFQKEIIWMIWELFLSEANKRSPLIKRLIQSFLDLFCLKYSSTCYKKRKNLLYLSISILCEEFILEKEIIRHSQIQLLKNILDKVDLIYFQIKKNEENSGTGYLFMDLHKSKNLENTIQKLEKMNTFGETFIPRQV